MPGIGIKNIILIIVLLFFGIIGAFFIWVLVFLPLQMVKPIEFQPIELSEKDFESAREKILVFMEDQKSIQLTIEEVGALLKNEIEQELGFEISDVLLQFYGEREVTAFFKSKITGIPHTGIFSYLLQRSDTEFTTTFVNAEIHIEEGNLAYSVNDFRIGRIKIPHFFISRFVEGERAIGDIYFTKFQILDDTLYLERK